MNKKIICIIIAIIVIVGIIFVAVRNNKKEDTSKNMDNNEGTTITKEEATDKVIENVKADLKKAGIELNNERKEKLEYVSDTDGYSYNIGNDMNEENRLEIYMITLKDKMTLFGDLNIEDGEVTIERGSKKEEGLLYGTILVLNCKDANVKSTIESVLK